MRNPPDPLPQRYALENSDGVRVELVLRRATPCDIDPIDTLVRASVRGLSTAEYTPNQIEDALGNALAVDSQLITDGTYFVGEVATV